MLKYQPNKNYGQNFLNNPNIAKIMVDLLNLSVKDSLIEIGGGYGALTKIVLEKGIFNNYTIYEIDDLLVNELVDTISGHENVQIKSENILDTLLEFNDTYKVLGAIPYNITSPIIHKFIKTNNRPNKIVLMIQKEVADKLIQKVPKANYWSYITLGYEVEKIQDVSPENFNPSPKVKSSIVTFTVDHSVDEIINDIDISKWEKFLHHVYKNPRKMLNKKYEKGTLDKLNIDSQNRPQNLTLENLLNLYNMVYHSD